MDFPAEPFKIKVIEPISITTKEEREEIIKGAHLNIFNVPSDKIYIDLLTDSGTSAMSDNQWSGIMLGDESYAGSKSYFKFEKVIRSIFGYKHIIPVHQGRVAENLLFTSVLKPDSIVPNNIHFDTTRGNIEHNNAKAVDLVIDEAMDPHYDHPFKGNMDIGKLEALINEVGIERIPLVLITITNNSGGGQPVSMENIRLTSEVCKKYGIPLIFDACRFAENCFFIKKREQGYEKKTILEIAQELFSYGNGCTMSAKKDGLVNIGGFLGIDDEELAEKITNLLIMIEGFPTYGGMAGRDLEAVARGLEEVLNENYLNFRISQVRYLGDKLQNGGVPILIPVGGHAVYINAKEFLPQIPQSQFPGVALTVALYKEGGIRAVEIGSLMFASKDPDTGEETYPELEMVRLAIPRRVYTVRHMDYVANTLIDLYNNRDKIRGLELTYQAPSLRHFTAKFKEVE
ncbi:tryptophanase [candidate division KSB1 bacterium]